VTRFSCPACTEPLADLTCEECEVEYPILGGVPLLVPSPEDWAATYRDAALAALAESGRADRESVHTIVELARFSDPDDRLAFGDDWTDSERYARPAPRLQLGAEALEAYDEFLNVMRGPDAVLLEMLGDRVGDCLELGPGAGSLSSELATRSSSFLVADLSLRSVFLALERAGGEGAVMDASWLALAPESLDTIVAANVIDLVDEPRELLERSMEALRPGGQLLLTTPAPERGLAALSEGLEMDVTHFIDGVPWLRPISARHHEIYAVQIVSARKRAS
jgi:SAM-dependent methyltransferase